MAKCTDPSHTAAMAAQASLSRTQFGRAALERHGHTPMPIEQAEAYEKTASNKGPDDGQQGA